MKIRFEFSGGSRDGQTDVGDTREGGSAAVAYYGVTHSGRLGDRFFGSTEYMHNLDNATLDEMRAKGQVRTETYEVTDRLETEDKSEVLVRCKFVGYGRIPKEKSTEA